MERKTHHKQLIELHKSGDWVCSTTIEYMRDHRKRYSELSAKGFVFEAMPCDGRCDTKHSSRLFMRRLKEKPMRTIQALKGYKTGENGEKVAIIGYEQVARF